ncbi:Uncharacterised protein [uncultured archaeon]|nr:Uncharacterised protein [uncultured archaeon]
MVNFQEWMKGVYILILRMKEYKNICVGRLGIIHFRRGYYAYVGSARGPGGFKRVTRHFDVASGENKTRKWHIDHILPYTEVVCAVFVPTSDDVECSVASALATSFEGIKGFGCSDCHCDTHLYFSENDMKAKIIDSCKLITGNESIIMHPNVQE